MKIFSKFDSFALFLLSFFYYLYYQRVHPLFGDEFNILVQAQRILDGQVPYRDFFQFITPGSLYLVAGWFKIFGNSLWSIRALAALQGSLIVTLTYSIIKKEVRFKIVLFVAIFLSLYFTLVFWPLISHHWLSTADALLGLWIFMVFLEKGKTRVLFFVGLVSGITYLFLQNKGALIIVALLLYIIIDTKFIPVDVGNKRKGRLSMQALSILLGFFLPVLTLIVYLSLKDALDEFVEHTIRFVFGPYQQFNAYPNYYYAGNYGIYKIFSQNPFPLNILRVRDFVIIGYVPPVLIGLAIYYLSIEWRKSSVKNLLLHTLAGIAMFCSVLYRADIVHLTTVWQFFLILLALLLDRWLLQTTGILNLRAFILRVFMLLLLFYGIHSIYKSIRFASRFKAELVTDIGSFYLSEDGIRDFYKNTLNFVKNDTGDAKIFVYNWSPFIYMLSGKKNPTGFDSIIPGYNTEEHLQLLVEQLEKKGVEYIFYDGVDEGLAREPDLLMYPCAKVNLDNPLRKYIDSNFSVVKTIRYDENTFFRIYKRR